ncbi:MAG: integrase [Betaproteobacteria bacterium]|nr:integrase [Betaproteobacteria bacterium]
MGRKRTKNLNLPMHMKARERASGTYYYYCIDGKEFPLGKDLVEAMRKWADMAGGNMPQQATERITFRYVAERYVKQVLPKKQYRTQKDNLRELEYLYQYFDNPPAPLDRIEPHNIARYRDWRVVTCSTKEIALLSHIWNWAREQGFTRMPNPCVGIRRNRGTGRKVYITDEMFDRVYACADQPTRDAMDLSYLAGQRPGDILRFTEHHIREGALWIEQRKTGARLRIQIVGRLKEVIDRIVARKQAIDRGETGTIRGKRKTVVRSTSLVVNEYGQALTAASLDNRFEKARIAAGVSPHDFQFRDLRAKAATDIEALEGMERAQRLLGHADASMTKSYVRNRLGKLVMPTK